MDLEGVHVDVNELLRRRCISAVGAMIPPRVTRARWELFRPCGHRVQMTLQTLQAAALPIRQLPWRRYDSQQSLVNVNWICCPRWAKNTCGLLTLALSRSCWRVGSRALSRLR